MEFIENFTIVDESNDEMSVAGGDEVRNESDVNFIDDAEEETDLQSQNLTAYVLANVTRDLQETLQDQSMTEYLGECSTPKNVVPDCLDEMEYEYDNFDGFEKRIEYSQTILKYSSHAQKNLFTTQYYSAFFIEVLRKKRLLSLAKMKKLLSEFWGKIFLKGSVESERISSSTSTCQPFRGSVRLLTIFWWRKIYS